MQVNRRTKTQSLYKIQLGTSVPHVAPIKAGIRPSVHMGCPSSRWHSLTWKHKDPHHLQDLCVTLLLISHNVKAM